MNDFRRIALATLLAGVTVAGMTVRSAAASLPVNTIMKEADETTIRVGWGARHRGLWWWYGGVGPFIYGVPSYYPGGAPSYGYYGYGSYYSGYYGYGNYGPYWSGPYRY
jgi:hypothetical protein